MLPTSNPRPRVARPDAREDGAKPVVFLQSPEPASRPASEGDAPEPLHPIGPERLAALRDAIRNGSYPTDADVLGGLQSLLGACEPSPGSARRVLEKKA